MLFFWLRRKLEYPEENLSERVENQQTQPMYDGGSGNRTPATLVRGKCSDDCANPAICMYVWPPYFAVILHFFTINSH